ncbi:MAG: long-chain fatty acid--CoA ligase [Clostridia bacterium]|nr:long-chain fatty acid--CoA ligase [Clostridia bacterium]
MGRVALIGENSVEYIDILITIWNNGDCAVLIDCNIPPVTAVEMMLEAQVSKCYIQQKYYDKISDSISKSISLISYEKENCSDRLLPVDIYNKFQENYSKDEAIVIYSSGTTGKSKGIVLSHFAINTNADSIIDYMQLTKDDCIYIVKNIAHSSSITGELLVALKTKTPIVIAPVVVPPRVIIRNIETYQVTQICINPTILKMLLEECRRKSCLLYPLRNIYVHGAKTHDKLGENARNFFTNSNIYFEYGLTEAGPRVTSQKVNNSSNLSVGKPILGVDVIIVDDLGNVVGANTKGIIHVKTPSVYSNYVCGDKKLPSLYSDWLNTGDIGYLDDLGELYIIGRKDTMINLCAHKIYPIEVEKQILAHSKINECVVTMVTFQGEDVLCCLYISNEDIQKDIKSVLSNVLMKYEIPKIFVRTDIIPKTRNGKVSLIDVNEVILRELKGV